MCKWNANVEHCISVVMHIRNIVGITGPNVHVDSWDFLFPRAAPVHATCNYNTEEKENFHSDVVVLCVMLEVG